MRTMERTAFAPLHSIVLQAVLDALLRLNCHPVRSDERVGSTRDVFESLFFCAPASIWDSGKSIRKHKGSTASQNKNTDQKNKLQQLLPPLANMNQTADKDRQEKEIRQIQNGLPEFVRFLLVSIFGLLLRCGLCLLMRFAGDVPQERRSSCVSTSFGIAAILKKMPCIFLARL